MMISARKEWLTAIIIGLLLLISYLVIAGRALAALAPPEGVDTLAEFSRTMPPPRHLADIGEPGHSRLVWIGETALIALPSGPSTYVFDENGKLIDWSPTTGDGESITHDCQIAWQLPTLSIDETLMRVRPE